MCIVDEIFTGTFSYEIAVDRIIMFMITYST